MEIWGPRKIICLGSHSFQGVEEESETRLIRLEVPSLCFCSMPEITGKGSWERGILDLSLHSFIFHLKILVKGLLCAKP